MERVKPLHTIQSKMTQDIIKTEKNSTGFSLIKIGFWQTGYV